MSNKNRRIAQRQQKIRKGRNKKLYLAIGFGVLERGLDVIGFHNLIVGGVLLTSAFVFFVLWFLSWERAMQWHIGWRSLLIALAALLYFPIVGFQVWKQHKEEAPPLILSPKPLPDVPESTALLRFTNQKFGRTNFPLKAGQSAAINFYYKNFGVGNAHNVHPYANMSFVSRPFSKEKEAQEIDARFRELYLSVNYDVQHGQAGIEISPNEDGEPFFTTGIPSLTPDEARGFNGKNKVLCMIARIEYDNTQWVERCVMFLPESMDSLSQGDRSVWNLCSTHNNSGIHRLGALL